ncbi:MAG TPA: ATP-binding protein [Polyangiales bacterium]|nr:ATP-binding protein [Polyangiales bacterium]
MQPKRIVVTGGPGGGKTSVWRELVSTHGPQLRGVPEVATLLFQHVFPGVQSLDERRAVQRAIFSVQQNLELIHEARRESDQVLLCDRGVPDGAGYWPEGPLAFFEAMGLDWEREILRYDAVLFLETAAASGLSIAAGNTIRTESLEAAVRVDEQLRSVWAKHPNCRFIACEAEFATKLERGSAVLREWLGAAE